MTMKTDVERFEDCILELVPLFKEHWRELGMFKDKMPLAPQWAEYIVRERAGILFMVTLRKDDDLIGYNIVQVANGLHYGTTPTAIQDIAYIRPDVRDRGYALPLFRRVERELKQRGIRIWYASCKEHNQLGMPGFLGVLGFQPADLTFAKWIG